MKLDGRTALVTGATGGLCHAIAPGVSATIQPWLGAEKVADDVARGQRRKS